MNFLHLQVCSGPRLPVERGDDFSLGVGFALCCSGLGFRFHTSEYLIRVGIASV